MILSGCDIYWGFVLNDERTDEIQMVEIQAEAEEKKMAYEIQTEKETRADEIQMAKVEVD